MLVIRYRACVLTLNTMDKYCEEGNNSPAKRPEFVDISMDKAPNSDSVETSNLKLVIDFSEIYPIVL